MRKSLFFLICIFLFTQVKVYSHWDILFGSDVPVDITMEIISIPFEGANREDIVYNRLNQIFCGSMHRRYTGTGNTYNESQLVYYYIPPGNSHYLESCFSGENASTVPRWGFAKYLITMKNLSDTNK